MPKITVCQACPATCGDRHATPSKTKQDMKTRLICACLCCTLAACHNVEKKAEAQLEAARTAYERGDLNTAKMKIDSIKILYPDAFDARRAGIALMQDIEIEEQTHTIAYIDSVLALKHMQLDSLRPQFVLEKDTAYQETGHYLAPSQVIERNMHRSYLRFQTDEKGQMSMTSIYCGPRNIHHTAVKVSTQDGSFAQTPESKDSYETTDLGEHIEKADYKIGEDGDVIGFARLNKGKAIRLQFIGESSFHTTLSKADTQAAADVYELSRLLSTITTLEQNKAEAVRKLEFVKQNKARRMAKDSIRDKH